MAIRVEKANNGDGYCCSCLDNKPHKRLYRITVKTFGSEFNMFMCENCAKLLLDGIHTPEDRVAPKVRAEEERLKDKARKIAYAAEQKKLKSVEAAEDEWPEDADDDGWGE